MARFLGIAAALAATASCAVTPQQMLSNPRRSAASASPDGSVALFTYSQYSFEKGKSSGGLSQMDLKTGQISDSGWDADAINEFAWLPGTATGMIYINGTNDDIPGGVTLWLADFKDPSSAKKVASLDAPYSGLKVAITPSGDLRFLVNNMAYPNGSAVNPEMVTKPKHTGRLFSDNYVRHWDTWLTKNRYAVFSGSLLKNSSYALRGTTLRNLNHDVKFTTTQSETPVQPFGDSGDYDISPDGSMYAFLSKAPQLNKANFTTSYIYAGAFESSDVAVAFNGPDSDMEKAGHKGASGFPTFSTSSSKLAYVQQDGDHYESDRWQLYTVDVAVQGSGVAVSNWQSLSSGWDRWVQGPLIWHDDDQSIYCTAEDFGRDKIYDVPIDAGDSFIPEALTSNTSVTTYSVLPDGSFFVTASAMWTPTEYYIQANGTKTSLFNAAESDPNLAGFGAHLFSEFTFNSSNPDQKDPLWSFMLKPTDYVEGKKYPLAFIIHGGPQQSWLNSWSYRWNMQTWADQGYIVVAPNPTGSTGYGQALTDAITGQWGGWPYQDLVNCWNYVAENIGCIDTDSGIAAGASYGGYMANWIQANDLGRKFKAIVTHDGISNTEAAFQSEELWFIRHDYNGSIWESDAYAKWNPQRQVQQMATPHFIVHNDLDYRLPDSDGISLFNLLQTRGVPSRFLSFPDENHWVLKPQNSLFWHTEIYNWINHYSKGTPLDDEPIGW